MSEIKFINIPQWVYDELPISYKKKLFFFKVTPNKYDVNGNIIKDEEWLNTLEKIKKKG